ncbi:MAG: RNA polymerase sigma factor, partial [Chloroflexota bacterium]|nr:RNA polymerase sigma factor [Chloroflexota bacterium]
MELSGAQMSHVEPAGAATNRESTIDTPIFAHVHTQELALIAALRGGDEAAFLALIEQFHAMMIRVAHKYVSTNEVAEEVVQETWLGVLRGLDRFEHRSSLKTWIFHILTNRAKSRAQREAKYVTFSEVLPFQSDESAVDADCFEPDGWWKFHPNQWYSRVEEHVLGHEMVASIEQAVQTLPPDQATVITLRDMEGWTAVEV